MDGEVDEESGRVQRTNKRSYTDFLMDVKDMEEGGLDAEEHSPKRPHKEPNGSPDRNIQHIDCPALITGSSGTDPELCESCGFLPACPCCVSQDGWTMRGEEEDNLLHSCCTAEGSIDQKLSSPVLEYWVYLDTQHNTADCHITRPVSPSVSPVRSRPYLSIPTPTSVAAIAPALSSSVSPMVSSFMTDTCSPVASMCGATSSAWDTLRSTAGSPLCSNHDLVSAAAHLHLLGESLYLIGHHLQETNKAVCMSSSFSLLLDSLLCALAPLISLTTQIPELRSCPQHTLASTLENIAYVMPGL